LNRINKFLLNHGAEIVHRVPFVYFSAVHDLLFPDANPAVSQATKAIIG
jgi:hypothetical protein